MIAVAICLFLALLLLVFFVGIEIGWRNAVRHCADKFTDSEIRAELLRHSKTPLS